MGEWSIGQTNSLVGGINHDIETLEEGITVDDIEALTRGRAEVIYDEIDSAGSPTDISVERAGPKLSVGSQFKGGLQLQIRKQNDRLKPMRIGSGDRKEDATHTTGYEEETLQGRELGGGDAEQSCRTVGDSSCGGLIFIESISRKKEESGSWNVY